MSETSTGTDGGPEYPAEAPLPPGPTELPILGSTLDIARRPISFLEEVSTLGDVVTYHVAGQRFTALLHPDHVEQVLVSESDRFRRWSAKEWGDAFGGYAGEGLLLSEGEQWRRQRLVIQNAFTPEKIQSYADAMVAETERAIETWVTGGTIDLGETTSGLTLRIIARTLFDLDIEGRGTVVRTAAATLNDRVNTFHLSSFLPEWVPTPASRRVDAAMGDLEDTLDDLIEERRSDASNRSDLLSLLLTATTDEGTTLSDQEIRDQLITFLFAGHETSSLALTYALHALGHDSEATSRLRAELDDVTGGDPPSVTDLPSMSYTEGVVKETLRLYPPAYAVFREALEDVVVGGYRIPAGSKVSLPQIHVHRDERFFDAPTEFRPDRWTDDSDADRLDYAYFPFGGGPRHCIGMRFATMELRLLLPTILATLDVEPLGDSELSFDTAITLQPAEPIEARITKRNLTGDQ